MPARLPMFAILTSAFAVSLASAPVVASAAESPTGPGAATSEAADPAEVFAYQGAVALSQQELDAAFSGIPEAQRPAFIRDGARVDQLVKTLLTRKAVAADAHRANFEADPAVAARVRLAAQKELAEAWLEHVVGNAPAADFEALAREDYLVNPDRYRGAQVVDVSHILIGTETRTDTEAKHLATSLRGWLEKDPSRFDQLVIDYSDDPEKAVNQGRYAEVGPGQAAPAFERAAFGLPEPGAISQPVRTQFGYHIIRLNGRSGGEIPPFDEIADQAIERARLEYLESYRARYLQSLLQEPIVIPDGAVDIMARRHFGEDLERAPEPAQ